MQEIFAFISFGRASPSVEAQKLFPFVKNGEKMEICLFR